MDKEPPKKVIKNTPSVYSTRPQPIINFDALKSRTQSKLPRRPQLPVRAGYLLVAVLICLAAGFGGGWLRRTADEEDR